MSDEPVRPTPAPGEATDVLGATAADALRSYWAHGAHHRVPAFDQHGKLTRRARAVIARADRLRNHRDPAGSLFRPWGGVT